MELDVGFAPGLEVDFGFEREKPFIIVLEIDLEAGSSLDSDILYDRRFRGSLGFSNDAEMSKIAQDFPRLVNYLIRFRATC